MDDLISRQAAIDALKEHRALYCDNTPDTFSKLSYVEKSRVDELDTAIATLVNLPSAQTEIIRCKDCKYRYIDEVHGPSCELDTGDPYATGRNADEDNWFCADAERRTDG